MSGIKQPALSHCLEHSGLQIAVHLAPAAMAIAADQCIERSLVFSSPDLVGVSR